MTFIRASNRMTFRRIFRMLLIQTDRTRYKDLQCNWIILCVFLRDLSHHLSNNIQSKRTYKIVNVAHQTMNNIFTDLVEYEKTLEKREENETNRTMIKKTNDYKKVIFEMLPVMTKIAFQVHSGEQTMATAKTLDNKICKPLMSNARIKEFLTEPFMQESISQMPEQGIFRN